MTLTAASRLGTERKQPGMSCRKVPGKWKTILKKQKIKVPDFLGQSVNITNSEWRAQQKKDKQLTFGLLSGADTLLRTS